MTTPANDDPREQLSAIVKTVDSLGLLSSSTITDDYSNTVSIGMSSYQKDEHTYALLERTVIPFDESHKPVRFVENGLTYTKKNDKLDVLDYGGLVLRKPDNKIHLVSNDLINYIELVDFPYGQYTLSLNGRNVATAKYNKVTKQHVFDFTNPENRSDELNIWIDIAKGSVEPVIQDRECYINFGRIDTVEIICTNLHSNFKFNDVHRLRLHGYILSGEKFVEKCREVLCFPNKTYRIVPHGIIESIDFIPV